MLAAVESMCDYVVNCPTDVQCEVHETCDRNIYCNYIASLPIFHSWSKQAHAALGTVISYNYSVCGHIYFRLSG